jgi:hypothetical protein
MTYANGHDTSKARTGRLSSWGIALRVLGLANCLFAGLMWPSYGRVMFQFALGLTIYIVAERHRS